MPASTYLFAACALTATLVVAAILGHQRLGGEAAIGLVIGALSGLALVSPTSVTPPSSRGSWLTSTASWLSVGWYLAFRSVSIGGRERPFGGSRTTPIYASLQRFGLAAVGQRELFRHAALVFGAVAVGGVLGMPTGLDGGARLWLTVHLGALLSLLVVEWKRQDSPISLYGTLAILFCAARVWAPWLLASDHANSLSLATLGLGGSALLGVIVTVLWRWWVRRRSWSRDARSALDPAPVNPALTAIIPMVGLVAVSAALPAAGVAWTPIGVVLSATACLIVGHLRQSERIGEWGLVVLAVGLATAWTGWLATSWQAACGGVAMVGLYYLWLSRFWAQQLRDGQAWTTAGRLIPSTRRLARCGAPLALSLAVAGTQSTGMGNEGGGWMPSLSAGLLLAFSARLWAAPPETDGVSAGWAGWQALLGFALVAPKALATLSDVRAPPLLWLGATGATAALLLVRRRRKGLFSGNEAAHRAHLGGVVPSAVLLGCCVPVAYERSLVYAVVSVGSGLLGMATLLAGQRARPGPALPSEPDLSNGLGERDGNWSG